MTYRFPFSPYPTGWFGVAFSHELAPGEVKPAKYFGRDLVMFRTQSGVAVVADAFCPHLGAHLGHGGAVVGETVRCPFHHWKFAADGACVEVPFCIEVPERARLAVWQTREVKNVIYVWHDVGRKAPHWQLPDCDDSLAMPGVQKYIHRDIHTHPQEIMENIVDCTHFLGVHGGTAPVRPDKTRTREPPFGDQIFHIVLTSAGGPKSPGRTHVTKSWVIGPGIVRNVSEHGPLQFTHTLWATPIDDATTRLRVSVDVLVDPNSTIPREQVLQLLAQNAEGTAVHLDKDALIWTHKTYRPQPQLSAVDGPIFKFRQWYGQFHSQSTESQQHSNDARHAAVAVIADLSS